MSVTPWLVAVTSDGLSVFASWDGNDIIGSGPAPNDQNDGQHESVSFRLDPTSGERRDVSSGLWRPAIDPSGTFAVAWDGSVLVPVEGAKDVTPGRGDLRIVRWPADGTSSNTAGDPIPGVSGAIGDFDVRWDETGSWLAVWIAEPADPEIGPADAPAARSGIPAGCRDRMAPRPMSRPCRASRSAMDGWRGSTPHGQDGQGSKVQVVAWSDDGVGATESVPGEGVVVVR